MPKYITWEASRGRWTFQLRIPEYARPHFDGRTAIRRHLGAIPEPEAAARAHQLAEYFKKLFDQYKPSSLSVDDSVRVNAGVPTRFMLDEDIAARFLATWTMRESIRFKERLDSLRTATDKAWHRFEHELTESRGKALVCLRRLDTDNFNKALADIQDGLNVRLDGTPDAFNALADEFNSHRLRHIADCIEVIRGSKALSSVFPDRSAQLPLIGLWGDPAPRLTEYWERRSMTMKGYVNAKTLDKYTGITNDLAFILGRRPVQYITGAVVEELIKLWSARKNGPTTRDDKLRILRSLVIPFDKDRRLEKLISGYAIKSDLPQVARLPFTDTQLLTFTQAIFGNPDVLAEDKMLLALMLLLGTRIEETYQLRAEDIEVTTEGWTVRFADHRQTGHGDARLKNSASARKLPLRPGVLPQLDDWLTQRVSAGGLLFPKGSRNRYGIRSSAASQRLNRLLRKLFPDDRRLVLQSTRNTAGRVMRRSNTDPRVRQRLLGHADVSVHDRHYDPAALLDDQDLREGADAIASYLSTLMAFGVGKEGVEVFQSFAAAGPEFHGRQPALKC